VAFGQPGARFGAGHGAAVFGFDFAGALVEEGGQPALAQDAGVRPIRLHDARHSCGTALHLRGVPLAVIAKWLGHADPAITARIYAHSQDEALRDASRSLGAVVTSS
jgi:hypothetical protein